MRERLKWLDSARGIGMLLVVAGHAATTAIRNDVGWVQQMYNYIFYIHMPFLFLLSGYSYQLNQDRYADMKFTDFFKKKAKGLIIPYFATTIAVYVIFEVLNRMPVLGNIMTNAGYGHRSIVTFLIEMLIGNNYFSIHLWYIYVLFFYDLITYILLKTKLGNVSVIATVILLGAIFVFATPDFSLAYANGCRMYLWFAAGLLCPIHQWKGKWSVLCFFLWNLLYALKGYWNVDGNNYLLWVSTVLMASVALLGLAQWLSGRAERIFSEILSYLGEHSMSIYLFHQPFWGSCFGSLFYGVLGLPAGFVVIASCALSLAVPLLIYKIFGRYRIVKALFHI